MNKKLILVVLARIPQLLYLLLKFRLKVSFRRRLYIERFRKEMFRNMEDKENARELIAYEKNLLKFSIIGSIRYFQKNEPLKNFHS